MRDAKIKMGVAVVSEEFAETGYLNKRMKDIDKLTDELGIECVKYKDIISSRTVSKKAGRYFKDNGVDAILVYLAIYAQDNLIIDIAYPNEGEIVLWSAEEPLNYPYPDIGAYCGATQFGGVLSKFDKKFIMIDGELENEKNKKKLMDFIKIVSLKKKLAYSALGMIGSRSDGMVENAFNELELRKQVGPEIIHIPLNTFFLKLKGISDQAVNSSLPLLFKKESISGMDENVLMESVKIYLVLKEIVEELELEGLTIKCWPELKANKVCSPCYGLSKLHDQGITTACEADTTALVSMVIGDAISGRSSFLSDLLKIENEERCVYYFHCGAASTGLAGTDSEISYDAHPFTDVWEPGIIVKFPVAPGRVIFARLVERDGKYHFVAYTGEAVKTDEFVKGNTLKVKLDKDPSYVVDRLTAFGTQHHQIMFYGDGLEQLNTFCKFKNIDLYEI
jgi:L-fucose isomerase-like protein